MAKSQASARKPAKGKSVARKRTTKRKKKTAASKPAARPSSQKITLLTRGLVQAVKTRGGTEFRIYSTYDDAVAAGVERGLAGSFFKAGNCTGACQRGEQRDKNGKLQKVWCVDINCSTGSSCRCHVIRIFKGPDGKWQEDDQGEHDKDDPVIPDGTSGYLCRCV